MRAQLRTLMDTLLREVMFMEAFACELAELAHQRRENGDPAVAEGYLSLSRHHCIRAIEGRAKIAALRAEATDIGDEDA